MFCPECGVKCELAQGSVGGECYYCPKCGTHWTHDGYGHGGYTPVMAGDTCPACSEMIYLNLPKQSDCPHVCEAVTDRLRNLGFPIPLKDWEHDDVLIALGECEIIRKA